MQNIDRRTFMGAAAAGVVGWGALGSRAADAPGKKLKLGLIGCGWYGMVDVKAAFKAGGVEVLALCDVDSDHLAQSAAEVEKLQGKKPLTFKQYEELLKLPELEAVIIATPPHWHALQFIAALERGLDIYCEKPLAYDIRESRAMADAALKSGRIVQIGFQRRQSPAFQQVRQYVQAGHAGRIVHADVQIHYTAGLLDATPQPPPPALDWDLWCGPGPKIPYSPQVGHKNWRLEKTCGQGHLVDWGIHLIDATRVMLGLGAPRAVTAAGGIYFFKDKITTPDILTAHFEFEQCPVTWRHRIWGAEEYTPEISNGVSLYGEQATVFVTDAKWIVIPRGKNAEREVHEVKADLGTLHMAEFLDAVRTHHQPGCSTADAHLSTTAVKLAMIAYDTGAKIAWETQAEQITDNAAATKLLKRDYRAPWQHPCRG